MSGGEGRRGKEVERDGMPRLLEALRTVETGLFFSRWRDILSVMLVSEW